MGIVVIIVEHDSNGLKLGQETREGIPSVDQGVALVMERSGSTMRMRSEGADRVKALKA